jgi:hypothetical protein
MTKKQTTKDEAQSSGTNVIRRGNSNGYGSDVVGGEPYDPAEYDQFGFRGSDEGWAYRNPGRTPRG